MELVENGHRDAAELLLDRGGRSSPKTIIEYHPECEFAGSYQRNNKRHGQKNLRCFPMCRAAVSHTPPICVHAITTITNPMYPPLRAPSTRPSTHEGHAQLVLDTRILFPV